MTDDGTRIRFLGAIAAHLPAHRVVEVHLFGPIRQGGAESGVAVIAVDPNEPVAAIEDTAAPDEGVIIETVASERPATPDLAGAVDVAEAIEALLDEPVVAADGTVTGDDSWSPYSDDALPDEAPAAQRIAPPRYTVYTARYRHTLKGPDRGRWEASVTEEADAPLLTVDAVVRGVSRRSGEADETVRLSGDEFRAAIPAAPPAGAPPASVRPQPAGARR